MVPQGLVRDHLWDYVAARNKQIMGEPNDESSKVHGKTSTMQQQQRCALCLCTTGTCMCGDEE